MGFLQPDMEEADIIVLWGANPATDSPLSRMVRLQAAKKRGAKIIAIDPQCTATAKTADEWIPVQPGTDGALIHGILRWCFKNGTIDREFGERFCEGFAELEEYVEQFTPEYVEAVTRVPKKSIEELATLFSGPRRVSFLLYTGLEYSNSGVQSIRAYVTLIALTGNIDIKGGQRFKFSPRVSLRKPDVVFPTDVEPIGMDVYPYHCKSIQASQFMEFPRSVLHEDPYKIRFLLIGGSSILTSFPNTELFRKSLEALDFVVSVDRFFTADCQYADIVLPATTHYEIASFCGYPGLGPPFALQYRQKIIEPIAEAMNDYLIYAKLAERLGYGHLYPQTEDEMVEFVIGDLPFSLDEFKELSKQGPISLDPQTKTPSYTCTSEEKKWASGRLRPDGKPGFPTPSGKWEIASSVLEKYGYPPLPEYEGVKEGLGNQDLTKDFPLTLTTGTRIQNTFRSQHLNIPGPLKRQPNAEALIHPRDAEPREIISGDKVCVKTSRGTVTLTARVTEDIFEGVVEANMGGGSPIQGEGWRDSNVNVVTDDKNRDEISGFPVLKALLCEVEKRG
jgi:anaerobic selenocysteine-containing dehydrogenase